MTNKKIPPIAQTRAERESRKTLAVLCRCKRGHRAYADAAVPGRCPICFQALTPEVK